MVVYEKPGRKATEFFSDHISLSSNIIRGERPKGRTPSLPFGFPIGLCRPQSDRVLNINYNVNSDEDIILAHNEVLQLVQTRLLFRYWATYNAAKNLFQRAFCSLLRRIISLILSNLTNFF